MPDGVLEMPAAVASQVPPAVDWMFGCSDAAHASGLILSTDSINRESGRHMRRIGLYSSLLASRLGWSGDEAARLQQAAALHDVGKLYIPARIMDKPGPLDDAERTTMQNHTVIGHRMLSTGRHPTMKMAATIALSHHECWDGSGYPYHLAGCAIPLSARIVAVADSYDALRMERSYKPGLSHAEAMDIILDGDGRTRPCHFDPLVLTTFHNTRESMRTIYETYRDL